MENNDERDITKNMLNTIRENSTRGGGNIIREFVEAPGLETKSVTGEEPNQDKSSDDDDVIELSGEERTAEEQKFRETIDASTKFNVFNIYPNSSNVVFGGVIQGMGGIEFQMTLEDTNGLYITGDNIQITGEVSDKIKKLRGFYDNWRDEWFTKLSTEYKPTK